MSSNKVVLEEKVFKLTPYPSHKKGQEQVQSGLFSMALSIFLLVTLMDGDWFTVIIAVYFLIVAFQLVLAGTALKRMPDRSRAVRIGPQGLYKMIEGSDVAQLPLKRIKALWKNDQGDVLWLCTQKGAQCFSPTELNNPQEWSSFVTHLERSLSHHLWGASQDLWHEVQENSHRMRMVMNSPSHIAKFLMLGTALSIPIGVVFFMLSDLPLEQLISGYPEVSFMLLGGSASWLHTSEEWGRLCVGPWMHFDLIQLILTCYTYWWTTRSLSRILGSYRIINLVLFCHLMSALVHHFTTLPFPLFGAVAPQVALLVTQWNFLRSQPSGLEKTIGASKNALMWLAFLHILIFSACPEQAQKTLGVDLLVGVVTGQVMSKVWSLHTPLWRLERSATVLSKFSFWIMSAITLFGFISYGYTIQQQPEKRLNQIIQAAPIQPTWTAQLAQMCASGKCNQETRLLLQERLHKDAQGAPLTVESHSKTFQTHLSQLRLSLAQDLETGVLSQHSIDLVTSRAIIAPNAPFADFLLSVLAGQFIHPELLMERSPQRSSKTVNISHLPHHELSPNSSTIMSFPSVNDISTEQTFEVHTQKEGSFWTLHWNAQSKEDSTITPQPTKSPIRLWLLMGEDEDVQALLSVPVNQSSFDVKLPVRSSASVPVKRTPWIKFLAFAPQPSAAKSQRLLIWRVKSIP